LTPKLTCTLGLSVVLGLTVFSGASAQSPFERRAGDDALAPALPASGGAAYTLADVTATDGGVDEESVQNGWRVSALSVGSGENPIASGLTGTIQLETDGGHFLEVTAQEEQAWLMSGRRFTLGKLEGLVAAAGGHLQGAPYVGPYVNLNVPLAKIGGQEVTAGLIEWASAFVGREPNNWRTEVDGIENPESIYTGILTVAHVGIGPVAVTYTWLDFLDEPLNRIPGVVYTQTVREDLEVQASAAWNGNAERAMYYIGATWRPRRAPN